MQREPWSLFKTLIALLLIFLCLWAAQWQYNRGVDRHARNSLINEHISFSSMATLQNVASDPTKFEWRMVTTSGKFNPNEQILLRNRYSEGVYGYEVLTLFTSIEGKTFWVDRGWVKAGKTATTPPVVVSVPTETVEINGRVRLDSSLPRGSFFALPASGTGLVDELNASHGLGQRTTILI